MTRQRNTEHTELWPIQYSNVLHQDVEATPTTHTYERDMMFRTAIVLLQSL